jgi:hypothetical protein
MADGGGPTEQCRSEGMPSLGEAPNGGAKPFGSFLAFEKGTRCKSQPFQGVFFLWALSTRAVDT